MRRADARSLVSPASSFSWSFRQRLPLARAEHRQCLGERAFARLPDVPATRRPAGVSDTATERPSRAAPALRETRPGQPVDEPHGARVGEAEHAR